MKKTKRSITAMVLAFLLLGSFSVMGAMDYSFSIDSDGMIGYSGVFTKTAVCPQAYFKQTNATPGYYQVRYCVATDGSYIEASMPQIIWGTDRASHTLSYYSSYASNKTINMRLKGSYASDYNNVVSLYGEWNPVD